VARRELVDTLWGDRPPPSAVNVVQTHVKHLRRLLEPGRAPRSGSGVLPHIGGGYATLHSVNLLTGAFPLSITDIAVALETN
jgi:hypothetical protein